MFRLSPTKEKLLSEQAVIAVNNNRMLDDVVEYISKIKGFDKKDAVIIAIMATSMWLSKANQGTEEVETAKEKKTVKKEKVVKVKKEKNVK